MTPPDPTLPVPADDTDQTAARVARRGLLRGGAVLAGAAGLAAAGAVAGATPAHAADGGPVVIGAENAASTQTTLTIGAGAGSAQPTLSLQNTNGPALQLNQLTNAWTGSLATGQVAGTATGPIVGVDRGAGPETTYLALGFDLDGLSLPVAVAPERLLDTRTLPGRAGLIGSTAGKFDSAGRLRAGQYVDLGLAPTTASAIDAIFANLTVTGPTAGGFLIVYPPTAPRPTSSAINYTTGQTIANGGFFATGVISGFHAVRIYASTTTHVLLDITGFTGPASPEAAAAVAAAASKKSSVAGARRSAARRTVKSMARR